MDADSCDGSTFILKMACIRGHDAIVGRLLQRDGINVNHRNNSHCTAAEEAQWNGRVTDENIMITQLVVLSGPQNPVPANNNAEQLLPDQQQPNPPVWHNLQPQAPQFLQQPDNGNQQRLDNIECKKIPHELICPVAGTIYSEEHGNRPVTLSSGHTISEWALSNLTNGHSTFPCPVSRKLL